VESGRGFRLVEIMIIVVILLILAFIAIPLMYPSLVEDSATVQEVNEPNDLPAMGWDGK